MKNAFLKLALVSTSAADVGALASDAAAVGMDVVDGVADTTGAVASTFGEKAMNVITNKYVLSGLAAVAVAGAAYGTYRLIKSRTDKAPAPVKLTQEQKVEQAANMLREVLAEQTSGKQPVAA